MAAVIESSVTRCPYVCCQLKLLSLGHYIYIHLGVQLNKPTPFHIANV